MRKIILISIVFIMASVKSFGQTAFEAGLRLGDQWGSEVAIDGTIPLGISPRLHPTLYLGDGGVGFASYFDWMFALDNGPSGLRFYPGVGPEMLIFNDFELAVAGNFGVEYVFDFPLTVGFDWRPSWVFTGISGNNFQAGLWGLTARYRFSDVRFRRVE